MTGIRARNRVERTRVFLTTALEIVTTEGFDALTMQRLADECDSAIGAVYRYFPSKGALVAEVQREAIDRIGLSYALIRDRSTRAWSGLDEAELSITRLVLFSRFICATADTLPQELRLLQMLMGEWRQVVPLDEGLRVFPTAMRLLDQLRSGIDEAVEHGQLDDSDTMSRVITWAAAVSGVMQVTRLGVFDAEMFDGDRLAKRLSLDLLSAWGASPAVLERAVERVESLATDGPLAPLVPDDL